MASKLTLHFEQLKFWAFHGLYEAEKKAGNQFEINLDVSFLPDQHTITQIGQTINYVAVYELIRKEMETPRELLETFLSELADQIKYQFPEVLLVKLNMYKLTMPIEGFQGRIGVTLERHF